MNRVRPGVIASGLVMALLVVLWHTVSGAADGEDAHLFVTGDGLEIDRCASAWLIKRHVDPKASFQFLPDEQLLTATATQFDTPYSEMQRTHQASTFEAVQRRYKVSNPKVDAIGGLIHDIEINFWAGKKSGPAVRFEYELNTKLRESPDRMQALDMCFDYLDNFQIN